MRWEDGAAELEAPIIERKASFASDMSSPETWTADIDNTPRESMTAAMSNQNEFLFEDAPFELHEITNLPSGLQLGPNTTSFLTKIQAAELQDLRQSFHRFSSLTEAEEQRLLDIAMPYRMISKVKLSSEPFSSTASHSSPSPSPSPEPESRTRKNKKRKSLADAEAPSAVCQSRKRGHNAIEKRYRTNLNDKINCLRQGVPSLCRTSSSESKSADGGEGSDSEEMDTKTGQQKYAKAVILTRALEYIKYLENTTKRLGSEVTVLKTRVGAFEKLAMSGSLSKGVATPSVPPTVKWETLQSI